MTGAGTHGTTEGIEPAVASTVAVAERRWTFSQRQPLSSAEFVAQAATRGLDLDPSLLRELYRHSLLTPFLYVTSRAVRPGPEPVGPEPVLGGTLLIHFRAARDRGRLQDLAAAPFKSRVRFAGQPGDPHGWWNRLIYSGYQLLAVPELKTIVGSKKVRRVADGLAARLPKPDRLLLDRLRRLRGLAVVLTALEARYLPVLDPEWVRLHDASIEEWREYEIGFDPVALIDQLGYQPNKARHDAEWLLRRAHNLDPLGGEWSRLVRRSPPDSWDGLRDTARSAMDYREAAEILLRWYTELASRGQAEPLPALRGLYWHPLRERLSYHPETLDQDLMRLRISPHPRVVLAIEGEAEEIHAPRVARTLGYPEAPELVRILKLGGVDTDLHKVAALAAAPLVGEKLEGAGPASWRLIKPFTRLIVAVDPEGKYGTSDKVERVRERIIEEIKAVLRAQGVEKPDPLVLDALVGIYTWTESCYEFENFSDDELAQGISEVHHTQDGLSRADLVASLANTRRRRKDIKEVWSRWDYKVSKVQLAEALWPVLAQKIQAAKVSPPAPRVPIAEVVQDAFHTAQNWRYTHFVLLEAADGSSRPTADE